MFGDGDGCDVCGGFDEFAVAIFLDGGRAEIERKRSEHVLLGVKNGVRPARTQPMLKRKFHVISPTRIRGDVRHDHGLLQKSRRATRSHFWAYRNSVHRPRKFCRDVGRCNVPQLLVVFEQQDRGEHPGDFLFRK